SAMVADRAGSVFPGRNAGSPLSNNSTEYRRACKRCGVKWNARAVAAVSRVVLRNLGFDYQRIFGSTSTSEDEQRLAVNAAGREIARILGIVDISCMWAIPGFTSSEFFSCDGKAVPDFVFLDDAIDLVMDGAADAFLEMTRFSESPQRNTVFSRPSSKLRGE
ncbi:MAG: hypothetical protein K2Z81_13635, partial [Cyanobacteria bacterium]|nr:hypothetical protein [Cyanobacteriota bacterium]